MKLIMSKIFIGKCIYCGKKEAKLTDEHWFPHSLGGRDILEQASCEGCQKIINSKFENILLHHVFANTRYRSRLPSRKNKVAKGKSLIFNDIFGRSFSVPPKDAPISIPMISYPEPGILCGRPPFLDPVGFHEVTLKDVGYESFEKKYPLWDRRIKLQIHPDKVAMLVAKIVHGALVSHLGVDSFFPTCPSVIIGDVSPYQFVGTKSRQTGGDEPLRYFGLPIGNGKILIVVEYDFFNPRPPFTFVVAAGIAEASALEGPFIKQRLDGQAISSDPDAPSGNYEAIRRHLQMLGLTAPP